MRIFRYLKKYWFFAILAPLFMIGEVLMDLVQPLLMKEIVDIHLINGDVENIILTGLKMLGLVFIETAIIYALIVAILIIFVL